MDKIFISYFHAGDQKYKNQLSNFIERHNIAIDRSVDIGEIDEDLETETIYRKIREEHLADVDVTIVLVSNHTKCRKHIDREIASSMRITGSAQKRSGILVIWLPDYVRNNFNRVPSVRDNGYIISNFDEFGHIFYSQDTVGPRIARNLKNGYIAEIKWESLSLNPRVLSSKIQEAKEKARDINPDLSDPYRKQNSENCAEKLSRGWW